ncbi:Flp family type IVb pilin [Glaciimonas immobilis]|uniref:Pilus assembly protein Flp/PilA n=1 Tax=Glaciimonas immobilis TaxID=728004 RepID=A0A840RK91_9BURK|nr:Flp family type IVb pilin [Glaciimonas immobilis]KAF3998820.1 Flp family type IVb pilin [Glaciimonas immobilis]MBB5198203.1 pilus assembly protein Flp/PilA [Glaciimonas immobilis]
MKTKLLKFLREEDGVTAIEYGLLAGLVAVAIIAGAGLLGTDLGLALSKIAGKVSTAVGP